MIFRIKEIREKKKMSQEELAIKSGVSRAIISNLESGTFINTTALTIIKIAKALEVKVSDIFFDEWVQYTRHLKNYQLNIES